MNTENLFVYYRISDKGNPKKKIEKADKYYCILNAIREFGKENFFVLADNCDKTTVSFLNKIKIKYEISSLGNSGSFIYLAEKIIKDRNISDYVYLLEDDYFHLPGSKKKLLEGLSIGDYVTLYDHPDKYILYKNGGNPFNFKNLNTTRIYITESSHWRETDSTTMTFACSVKTLKEDLPIWKKYTKRNIPEDFRAFVTISQNKLSEAIKMLQVGKRKEFRIILKNWIIKRNKRIVVSSIPASATHVEVLWLSPVINWIDEI